ncbi:hypothetical protein [Acidisphaera sp. S103]|uniref:hypothetical protein n=1 Tax=Acidisphaera sp. S103 TaxID=1747223 RepID=UPI00131E29F5|nr:hypothetical protein [Acidisphaera sp. S103]
MSRMQTRFTIIPALLLCLQGCTDHRKAIAMAILYPHEDEFSRESNDAFTGAILGRFPIGSDVESLRKFAVSLGAGRKKGERTLGQEYFDLICPIPEYITFGYESSVSIQIHTDGPLIKNVRVTRGGVGF